MSYRFTFGRFQGRDIQDVPTKYLQWFTGRLQSLDEELCKAVFSELERREQQKEATTPVVPSDNDDCPF